MFVMIMLLMITIVIIFFVDDYDDIFNYVIDDNDITNDDYDEPVNDAKIKQFDDEEKLKRTVFIGNLPLNVKKKALVKQFSQYGPIESARLRSIPLLDVRLTYLSPKFVIGKNTCKYFLISRSKEQKRNEWTEG